MKIKLEVRAKMVAYHKLTMKELVVDNVVKQEYDENSSEFEMLCKEYEQEIGYRREIDSEEFDKKLVELCIRDAKESQKETVNTIFDIVKQCYRDNKSAYVMLSGMVLNPQDFCAIQIKDLTYNVVKE